MQILLALLVQLIAFAAPLAEQALVAWLSHYIPHADNARLLDLVDQTVKSVEALTGLMGDEKRERARTDIAAVLARDASYGVELTAFELNQLIEAAVAKLQPPHAP